MAQSPHRGNEIAKLWVRINAAHKRRALSLQNNMPLFDLLAFHLIEFY
jgi:hypothetical protein